MTTTMWWRWWQNRCVSHNLFNFQWFSASHREHPWHPYLDCSFISRCSFNDNAFFSVWTIEPLILCTFFPLFFPSCIIFCTIFAHKNMVPSKIGNVVSHIKLHHFRRNRNLYCFYVSAVSMYRFATAKMQFGTSR